MSGFNKKFVDDLIPTLLQRRRKRSIKNSHNLSATKADSWFFSTKKIRVNLRNLWLIQFVKLIK